MLLCKELILIRDQPPKQRGSPESHLKGDFYLVWKASQHESLLFLQPLYARSLLFCLCPFLSLCHVLSSRIKHNAFSRGWLLSSPSLACSHIWASSTIRGRRLTFWGQPLLLHSMGREQGWGHLRANLRFRVFWFIPLLLSKPIFGQPPL